MADDSIPELSPEEARRLRKNARAKQRRLDHPDEVHAVDRAWRQRNLDKERERGRFQARKRLLEQPEKVRAQRKESKAGRKAAIAASWQRYYAANHERLLQASRNRRAQYPEKARAADHKWKKANPETQRAWRKKHPEKIKAKNARRRAHEANAPINDFTDEQWEALCKAAGYRCCYCGKKGTAETLTPDHLTPYVEQGSNTLHNVLPCCGSCNSRKKDRAVLKPVQPFLLLPEDLAE